MTLNGLTRRAFLRQSGTLGVAGLVAPWAMNLAAMAEAAAAEAGSDYKALVCVFLQGGNDHANTLIPVDAEGHAMYARMRGALALPLSSLAATTLAPRLGSAQNQQMALAPNLAALKPLFDAQRMAVLLNIGPLVQPTTLAQFQSAFLGTGDAVLPPKLFSHNDQQSVWQSYGGEGEITGWGGVIGDAFYESLNASSALTCINLAGNAVYLAGNTVAQFMVNSKGPAPLKALQASALFNSTKCSEAFQALATTQDPAAHRMSKEHSKIMSRAIGTNTNLLGALVSVSPAPIFPADGSASASPLAANPLAVQLNTVARIIAARDNANIKVKRQVFFVALAGFDHHDNLVTDHPAKLAQVAQALSQFDQDLGPLRDQVTTFTASDFGRTMASNGNGSDHGWGSYHFVMGGAVNGGRYFGELPDVGHDAQGHDTGAHNIGQGRLLPTLAVDQLAEALARWMEVTNAAQLDLVAPHRHQFSSSSNNLSGLFKA
ncbi:DUF1501 domain-containing protein [Aquabacterium sp.]|uniref:DUF1501 domain-containing protein n=1 Tax=Aquabacterium sp. TaxID=1872578 RepID=UPI0019C51A83|nr:DUF1501 domain-containing protein [Aquabacterium sp.]MBC7701983.1 DUF1501 domain-containing protein [Aquabacterium sp.]